MERRISDTRRNHPGEPIEPPALAPVHLVQMHLGLLAIQGEEAEVPSSEVGQEVEPHPTQVRIPSELQARSQGATPGTPMTKVRQVQRRNKEKRMLITTAVEVQLLMYPLERGRTKTKKIQLPKRISKVRL